MLASLKATCEKIESKKYLASRDAIERLYQEVLESLKSSYTLLFDNKQFAELNALCENFRKIGHLDDIGNLYIENIAHKISM